MPRQTKIQETSTRKKVDLILKNLGWIIDEEDRNCNVTTESPKTREQAKKLERKKADYFLYKSGTDRIIALIETKRPDESIKDALSQAIEYAEFLNVNIVFATDGTITQTYHLKGKSELRKDGEFIGELLSEKELIKFIDSPEIESPRAIQYTKQELIKIFQRANELLRKDGLREGIERFTEFSNLLFMRMISEIEDEREQEGLPRRLEKRYCWDSFKGKDGQEILDYINDTILPKLVNKYNGSGDVFQNELNIKNPDTIKEIVDKLSKLNLIDIESDVKGDAFEYFLKESVTVGNDLGEYFTPRHIVKLIVRLVDPKFGDKVYDPCCGTGGFLIEAYKHLWNKCNHTSENTQFLKEKTIYGREITGTAKIAKMNMILAGDGHTNIKQMDSLEFPVKSRFGVVLTNFPFSQKTDYGTLYGFNTSDANPIFIKHIIDSLEEGGRAGIITFQGLLYDQIETYKKIRQFLVENCYVEGIIKLHNYVFQPYTSVNTSIIILKKGKPAKNIWFFVVNEDGFEKTSSKKGRSPIEKNDLKMLEEVWAEKRNSEKSWAIDIQTIKSNSYILNAETYKPHKKSESKFQLDVLSKHVDIINEKGAKGKNRYVEIGDIELDSKNYFYKEKPSVESCKKAFLGNIIISTVRPTRGAISYIKEEEITVSSAFLVIKSNELVITNRFLYFLLAFNNKFYTYMGDKAQGSTYPTIKEKEILNFKIPLISKETQEQKLPIFENRLKIILDTSNSIKSLTDNLFDPFLFNGGY
ncbi:MAG: N-6 DNA methylase [Candidatus Omnitrophica bacterium]|nr:N-6 DNA methylase [Candidatus Omnitrophota bacterium]